MSAPVETSSLLSVRNLLMLAIWSAALFGTLQVHQSEGLFGHAICGPWGCGPPVSALVGYHTFWCLLILPVALILRRQCCGVTVRNLGAGLILVSVSGIIALLLYEGLNNSAAEKYFVRWCSFRVATFIDFPLVQLGLAGLWLRLSAQSSPKVQKPAGDDEEDDRSSATQAADL